MAATLAQLVAESKARAGARPGVWAIVDAGGAVIEAHERIDDARAALHAFFDEDPGLTAQLRCVLVRFGREARIEWPRRGTPAERARALVRTLAFMPPGAGAWRLKHAARDHYLRARVLAMPAGGPRMLTAQLTWMSERSRCEPVGFLTYRRTGPEPGGEWSACLPDGEGRPGEEEVCARVAEAMARRIAPGIGPGDVAAAREREQEWGPPSLTAVQLIAVAMLDAVKRCSPCHDTGHGRASDA